MNLPRFAPAAAIFLIGLALRLFRIGQEAWFVDEVVTKRGCAAPSLLAYVRDIEGSPPLYPFLVRLWASLFGAGLESLRSFSALCGAAGGAFVYLAAGEARMSRANRWIAALAFAASPMAIWHGQQARMYALLATLAALWIWLALRARRSPSIPNLAAVFAAAVAGASTHYYFPLLLIPGAALFLALRDKRLVAAHVAAFAAMALLLPLLREQLAGRDYRYIPRPGLADLAQVYGEVFILGPLHRAPAAFRAAAIALPLLTLAALAVSRLRSPRDSEVDIAPPRGAAALLAVAAFAPVLLSFAISQGRVSYFIADRYTILALPGFVLLVCLLAGRLPARAPRVAASSALALLLLGSAAYGDFDYFRRCQEFDWRTAVGILDAEWREGDRIVFMPGWLAGAYGENGGARGPSIPAETLARTPSAAPGRIWLFQWEQNPEEPERRLAERLAARPGARIRVDFPVIRLREIPP